MNGSLWILSYLLLWGAVLVLGFTVVALLRQIGVLHTRIAPMGVHFAGEGPELDSPAPTVDDVEYGDSGYTVLAFTSPTCEICAKLKPALLRIGRAYAEIDVRIVDHATDASTFGDFRVRSTPYLVAVDSNGIVRSRGVANTLDQVEEMLAEILHPGFGADTTVDLTDADGALAEPTDVSTSEGVRS